MMSDKHNILIVEDSPVIALSLEESLEELGYEVLASVDSGEEALTFVESKQPDLILMDIMLDGDLDGIETTEEITASHDIPVIYITAYSNESILDRAKITAPYGYILKPFNEREIHINIEIALEKHRMQKKIAEKDKELNRITENVKDVMFSVALTEGDDASRTRVKYVSSNIRSLIGVTPEKFYNNPGLWLNLIHPEDIPEVKTKTNKLINEKKEVYREFRIQDLSRNGSTYIWFGEKLNPELNGDGDVTGFMGVARDITEQKRAQQKLHESEKKFRELWEASPDALITVDKKGIIIECNRQVENILGYNCDDLKGEKLEKLVPNDSKKRHKTHRKDFFKTDETRAMGEGLKLSALHKSGELVPVEISLSHHNFDDGKVVLAAIRDVTERRKAADALAKQRRKLEDAIRGGNLGTWEWNIISGEIHVNNRWLEMLGLTHLKNNEISATAFRLLIHPDDAKRFKRKLAAHFSGRESIYECEFRIRHSDGDWVWVQSRGKVSEWTKNGDPKLITGTHQDITKKKKAVQLIKQNRRQLRVLIDSIPVLITYLNTDLKYVFANKEYAKWYRTTVDNVEGSFAYDILNESIKQKVKSGVDRVLQGEKVSLQATMNYPIGERTVHCQYIPHYNDENKVIGFFALVTDITDIKNKQNLLEKALEEKQILLKEVHHRVKNNLNIIKSLIEMYQMDNDHVDDLTEIANKVDAIASFHDKLYQSEDLTTIDLESYLFDLIYQIMQTYNISDSCARIEFSLKGFSSEANIAINSGLIINELISNSQKHAFGEKEEDFFDLSVSMEDGQIHIQYFDSGTCLKEDPFDGVSYGGLALLDSIVTNNLEGNIETDPDHKGHFLFNISFPV